MCILLSFWDRTYQNTCLYYSYLHNFKCNVYNSIKMMPGNAVQMGFIFFILHGNKSYLFKTWKAFWSSANGFCLYILISMNVSLIYVHISKVNIWHLVNAKMSGKTPTVHQCDKLIRNMASRLENKISVTWILFNSFILSNFFDGTIDYAFTYQGLLLVRQCLLIQQLGLYGPRVRQNAFSIRAKIWEGAILW